MFFRKFLKAPQCQCSVIKKRGFERCGIFCSVLPVGFMLRWSAQQGRPLISEREYSHGEVTGWRRSCSGADTCNMKV